MVCEALICSVRGPPHRWAGGPAPGWARPIIPRPRGGGPRGVLGVGRGECVSKSWVSRCNFEKGGGAGRWGAPTGRLNMP
jgi:hypothetical protein